MEENIPFMDIQRVLVRLTRLPLALIVARSTQAAVEKKEHGPL